MKVQPKQSTQRKYTQYNYSSITYGYTNGVYGPKNVYNGYGKPSEEETATQQFKLLKPPSQLDKMDIVWNIALQCQNEVVVPKAIDFLIKVFYSIDSDLNE